MCDKSLECQWAAIQCVTVCGDYFESMMANLYRRLPRSESRCLLLRLENHLSGYQYSTIIEGGSIGGPIEPSPSGERDARQRNLSYSANYCRRSWSDRQEILRLNSIAQNGGVQQSAYVRLRDMRIFQQLRSYETCRTLCLRHNSLTLYAPTVHTTILMFFLLIHAKSKNFEAVWYLSEDRVRLGVIVGAGAT